MQDPPESELVWDLWLPDLRVIKKLYHSFSKLGTSVLCVRQYTGDLTVNKTHQVPSLKEFTYMNLDLYDSN